MCEWVDRDVRAGEKFADSDLIGIPYRIVISEKTLAEKSAEIKVRATGNTEMRPLADLKVDAIAVLDAF